MAIARSPPSRVLTTPAASPKAAYAHFCAKLEMETDPSDVWTDMQRGDPPFILVDTRAPDAFEQEHIPGAINIPHATMDERTTAHLDKTKLVVVYCAGVHCNASTKGARKLSRLGFPVKEMLHGLEGWKLEGYAVEGTGTRVKLAPPARR